MNIGGSSIRADRSNAIGPVVIETFETMVYDSPKFVPVEDKEAEEIPLPKAEIISITIPVPIQVEEPIGEVSTMEEIPVEEASAMEEFSIEEAPGPEEAQTSGPIPQPWPKIKIPNYAPQLKEVIRLLKAIQNELVPWYVRLWIWIKRKF